MPHIRHSQRMWGFSLALLFHFHLHPHPRVNAALEEVFALREIRDVHRAPLNDPGLGNGDILETTGAFRNGVQATVEREDETSTELLHFRERVRFTALVGYDNRGSLLDRHLVRLEIPAGVRMPLGNRVE